MILEEAKEKVESRLKKEGLFESEITVKAKVLSPQEAIGNPERDDFPLLKGRERIMEANFKGHLGHAFTDMYGGFEGQLNELFDIPLNNNYRRALMVATINALSKYWGLVEDTVHCKDNQPQKCAKKCIEYFKQEFPEARKIALIGFQPALAEEVFQYYTLRILDLNKDNIGQIKFNVQVLDGQKDMKAAVKWADIVFATGSTSVNGTIDGILEAAGSAKRVVFYGVTIAGVAYWMGLQRICFTQ